MMIESSPIELALNEQLFNRHPAEAVRELEQMDYDEARKILSEIPVSKSMKVWERYSPQLAAKVLIDMPLDYVTAVISHLEPNRAASFILAITDKERREKIIHSCSVAVANDLRRAISQEPESAGALMDTLVIYFRPEMTVSETINILRGRPRRAYRKLFTVDDNNHLDGMVEIEDIALANHETTLAELQITPPEVVNVNTKREDIVSLFEKKRIYDLPVVDFEGRLVGVLRYHTLLDAALEETSADLQTMVGVSKDERALSPAFFSVRKRLPWLQINLLTAFMAAAVVGVFESTIAKYTALAVLLPVVAGQSGNTGAQALAVTMRGLALKEIYPRMWPRIVFKEINVGLWNGILVAVTTALGVFIWSESAGLTLVIILSMILSMIIASIAGAVIPILLTVTGQDPAQSSSIFLTTVTDIAGFFSFLGIATLFISIL
jgi:magnesium transporter